MKVETKWRWMTTMLPLLVLFLLASVGPVSAQEEGDEPPPAEEMTEDEATEAPEEEQEEPEWKPFSEIVGEDAVEREGFFRSWQDADDLWIEIPTAMLETEFLMEYKIARGLGNSPVIGGTMLSIFEGDVVAFERHGDKIFLVERPYRFHADDDPRAAEAVDLTFGSSVVETADIASIDEEGTILVSVGGWFLNDLANVSPRIEATLDGGRASVDRSRSHLEMVAGYPDNLNVQAKLTFRPSGNASVRSVPDSRFLPVSLFYSMARLPERPMEVRVGDDRMGNFLTVHKDFSTEDSTFFRRKVNRWRLECGERVGDGLCRPVEPIVYYIDHTVPAEYHQAFREGTEAWNEAFREAGFVDAIRSEMLPEEADAEDIRYATLRWNVSDQSGYGAIGPSTVDPRTGEILDADVLFEANFFNGFRNVWEAMAAPVSIAEAFEMALGIGATREEEMGLGGLEMPGYAQSFQAQASLAAAALVARGELDPGDPLPREVLNEWVRWVVMHEVGHSLGLQHNFRSSASTPFDRLHDERWTRDNGVFSSVMEYPQINISPEGEDQGHYYNPEVGSYDRWVIAFAYTPDADRAARLARQAADPRHLFGNEAGGPGALDPTINIWDLSADPIAWGEERTAIIHGILRELPEVVLEDNEEYAAAGSAFSSLMGQYGQALAPSVKYLGGQYLNRDHVGDPNGRLPFENVERDDQERALRLIVDRVFAADAFEVPSSVLQRLAPNMWSHWGISGSFNGRLDFPFHEQVLGFQNSMMSQLLHPWRLSRIRDGETKFGQDQVITIPELMGSMTDAVWSEVLEGPTDVVATRRDLQRAHLDLLMTYVTDLPDRAPADARSVARMELMRLSEALGAADVSGLDAYTRAHLMEVRAQLDELFDD